MPAYEQVKSQCLAAGQLWEDPNFPTHAQASVFYHQTPPFTFTWKRAKDIYTKPSFILDKCTTFDVVPGKLGDKWLASCIGLLYLNKGLFQRVVPPEQRLDGPTYTGVFRFRMWWYGQWMEVLVDDRLPTVNGRLAFLQTSHTEQLWPALLEKAYAKLHGSYEALKYGNVLDGFADMTGGIPECLALSSEAMLANMLVTASIVTAIYAPKADDKIAELEVGRNYMVCDIEEIETSDGRHLLVLLKRPLPPGETPLTHVALNNSFWNTVSSHERERLFAKPSAGFWIPFGDFQRVFSRLEIVHLESDTSKAEHSLVDKMRWEMKIHHGSWRRGVSAGGCRNFPSFFHLNPQIQITLNEPDTVFISLSQHSITEPKVIGFSVYKNPKLLSETAPPTYFKRIKSTINSQYSNSRQVSHRCQLDASSYLVIPTTFEPREEAVFSLRIFSNKPLKMKVLDHAPEMVKSALVKAPPGIEISSFAQYEAAFLQLADEYRTIDAFELQELLDACLPNDYIKSCTSIETCRQIVLSLDEKGIGRISLSDFKNLMCSLKHWQLVFKSHSREKIGVLLAERLREALRDVGFVVPDRAMTLLVIRYMRKDGMLRFGDFVSAVMHLHRAFSVYYSNRSFLSQGIIYLNLSEWLQCALMC